MGRPVGIDVFRELYSRFSQTSGEFQWSHSVFLPVYLYVADILLL